MWSRSGDDRMCGGFKARQAFSEASRPPVRQHLPMTARFGSYERPQETFDRKGNIFKICAESEIHAMLEQITIFEPYIGPTQHCLTNLTQYTLQVLRTEKIRQFIDGAIDI